jgi:hypothetical protein
MSVAFRKATEGMDDEELLPNFEERFYWAIFDEAKGKYEKTKEPPSEEIAFLAKLSSWITEIEMSLQSIKDTELYVRRFPYGDTDISKTRHLRRHIEKYLEEFYILKERLVEFVDTIEDMYSSDYLSDKFLVFLRGAKTVAKKTLDPITGYGKVRGSHVHKRRYITSDIDKLVHMEDFADLVDDDENISGLIKNQRDRKCKKVRKEWAERVRNESAVITKMLNQYFNLMRAVVFEDDCTLRLPTTE